MCEVSTSLRKKYANWKKSTEGSMVIAQILRSTLGICPRCKGDLYPYHVDHIKPISKLDKKEGWKATHPSNLICICKKCNLKKGAKAPNLQTAGDI